ncbi:MAG: AMP-binding protein [Bacteroides sp.]|nr:AMP-binding protein [Bacteroides sp.]
MDLPKLIGTATPECQSFIDEWYNDSDYVVVKTSGSTGTPKEIKLYKDDMLASARRSCRFFGIDSTSTLAIPLSINYIAGKMAILRAICSGAKIWIESPSSSPLLNYNAGNQIDLTSLVPSQLQKFIGSQCYKKTKQILVGGAPMSSEQEQEILEKGINCYISYGMTETCSHVALRRAGENFYHTLPGITIDTDQRRCLIINNALIEQPQIITNDIVSVVDNTTFQWLGRFDNVINSGGIKFFPEKLEQKISHLMGGHRFYITSRRSKIWGEEIILVVEGSYNLNFVEYISTKMRSILDRYEFPKEIIFEESFELTLSGKIKRKRF